MELATQLASADKTIKEEKYEVLKTVSLIFSQPNQKEEKKIWQGYQLSKKALLFWDYGIGYKNLDTNKKQMIVTKMNDRKEKNFWKELNTEKLTI